MRLTRRLFFIGLGLTTLVAVGSYWWQLAGLAGPLGIAPMGPAMEALRANPSARFFDVPTLLWLSSAPWMLNALCAVAFGSGLLLVVGVAPRWACLALWASWLSLVQLGHPFLSFQWDVLLVEAAFFSTFFAPPGLRPRLTNEPEPRPAFRAVLLVLAVKVTFESGVVKLTSGDPAWRDLTALTYHWWSQPLPTWSSVWIAQLPGWVQQVFCALMFVFELAVPLLAFGPRLMRLTAGVGLLLLQAALFAAGNYSFYNLLAFVLALPLLDDAFLRRVWKRTPTLPPAPAARFAPWLWVLPAAYLSISGAMFLGRRVDSSALRALRRFDTINAYGAFAWMTKTRDEISLEGSVDGVSWRSYELPWKPGDVTRRPDFVAPFQPRLDWQLWFAALGTCQDNPWVLDLQQRLLEHSAPVRALFAVDPFPDTPPRLLRTRTFEYRFAPWNERGVWWTRTEKGPYCPPVRRSPGGGLERAD